MAPTSVTVRLYGRWGLPELEHDLVRGPVDLDLPDAVTAQNLLRSLGDRFGPRFQRKALRPSGALRAEVRVFIDDVPINDLTAEIGDKLRPGTEFCLMLLAPFPGG